MRGNFYTDRKKHKAEVFHDCNLCSWVFGEPRILTSSQHNLNEYVGKKGSGSSWRTLIEPQHQLSLSWMPLSLGPQLTGSRFSSVSQSHDVFMKMLRGRLDWERALLYFSPTRVLPPKGWGVCIRPTVFLSSTSYMTEKSSAPLSRNWPCPLRVLQFLYSGQAEKQCTEWKCPEWQCPDCVLRAKGLRGSALRNSGQTGNILRGSLLKGNVLTGYWQAMYWEAVSYQCTERRWTEGTVLTGGGQLGTVWIGRISRINVLPVSWEAVDRKQCVDRQWIDGYCVDG